MSAIHLLENNLINKIAAGEVVERPASVVKELIENSIDAGATSVTVEIKDGGIDLIKISDNGSGISKDDIPVAFMRHATSKLSSIEDLEDILTLGFRGEALSSIASVAQVEMITKTADDETGHKFIIHGGKVISESDVGANRGTVITVKNIFFNTPARRKFLKKPSTEAGYISDVINRAALGHPDIAIKYINNGNTIISTSGNGDLKAAVLYVYGKDMASKMLELDYSKDGFSLKGLIAKPELSRGNRSYENFFINGRYIVSDTVKEAVEEAYKGKLTIGKFPVFILNLTVPANTVDVNVHPTKLEVRFSDENLIYDIMYDAVDKVLRKTELIPQVSWDKPKPIKKEPLLQIDLDDIEKIKEIKKAPLEERIPLFKPNNNVLKEEYEINPKDIEIEEELRKKAEQSKKMEEKSKDVQGTLQPYEPFAEIKPVQNTVKKETDRKPFFTNYKIIGQIFNTYWIIEQNNNMYLIDQHAAHEKVLYERFNAKFKSEDNMTQMLITPVAVNLSEREKNVLVENRELLEKMGFVIEELGVDGYALKGVPYIFDEPSNISFFTDIIDMLSDKNINNIYDTKYDAIATMSCKAAVKGNNRLSYAEAQALIKQLLKLENPFTCPHGRPTIIEMSRYELEKKFKRVQN